jgi:hypothetical protein
MESGVRCVSSAEPILFGAGVAFAPAVHAKRAGGESEGLSWESLF